MPLLTAGPSRFLGGGAGGWWLAGGTIPLANVLEHVENPANRQEYAGGSATGDWTIAFRTNLITVAALTVYAFDAQSGRVGLGIINSGASNGGLLDAATISNGVFATGDHSYMFVNASGSVQYYRDDVEVGAVITSTVDIGGTARWRSRYADSGGWLDWPVAIPRGLVANIALDATQRAALHASLMA